tara:strand:- start:225 stop:1148 length:924 start_codon:yes stop_codon:yes gene_type:complete
VTEQLATHAEQTIQAGSKSFAVAARLFDPPTRRNVMMLYTWCRHCDDQVDGQELGRGRHLTDSDVLQKLEAMTHRACAGEPMSEPAFAALQAVVQQNGLPERYLLEHLQGFAMDVREHQYETIEDTLTYCYHVAGVVGLMMAWIMGARDEATLDRACDLGMAFQLTNIARDIVEDAAIARCYLPAAWLREEGLCAETLAEPDRRSALARLAGRLIALAEPYYQSAREGLSALPLRSAWAIATALAVYREIGLEVRSRGASAWDERVSTSKADKLRLLAWGAGAALGSRYRKPSPRLPELWNRPPNGV